MCLERNFSNFCQLLGSMREKTLHLNVAQRGMFQPLLAGAQLHTNLVTSLNAELSSFTAKSVLFLTPVMSLVSRKIYRQFQLRKPGDVGVRSSHTAHPRTLMPGIYTAILGCLRWKIWMWRYLWSWLQNGGPTSLCERGSKTAVIMVFWQKFDSVRNLG